MPDVTCSYPASVEWLVANIRTVATAAQPTVVVSDGVPGEASFDEIIVGTSPRDEESEGDQQFIAIGQEKVDEEYDIPIVVTAWRGGKEQKTARDACFVLFNAAMNKIRSDRTLGGAISRMYPAEIKDLLIVPSAEKDRNGGSGRRCTVHFNVHCRNRF